MYDPSIGRWTSEDPLGFDAGDENLYRYAGNHPTTATDPSGLAWQDNLLGFASALPYVNPMPNYVEAWNSGGNAVNSFSQGNIWQGGGHSLAALSFYLPGGSSTGNLMNSVAQNGVSTTAQNYTNQAVNMADGSYQMVSWGLMGIVGNPVQFYKTGNWLHLVPFYSISAGLTTSAQAYDAHVGNTPLACFLSLTENHPTLNILLGVGENFNGNSLHSQNFNQPLTPANYRDNWYNFLATVGSMIPLLRPARPVGNLPPPNPKIITYQTAVNRFGPNFIGVVDVGLGGPRITAGTYGPNFGHLELANANFPPLQSAAQRFGFRAYSTGIQVPVRSSTGCTVTLANLPAIRQALQEAGYLFPGGNHMIGVEISPGHTTTYNLVTGGPQFP